MKIRLSKKWPSPTYRGADGLCICRGESADVDADVARYLLDTFPQYFKRSAKPKVKPTISTPPFTGVQNQDGGPKGTKKKGG